MENQEITVSLEGTENMKELVIRRGEALRTNEPKSFHSIGTLSSPLHYFKQRGALNLIDKGKCVVQYRKVFEATKGSIFDGNPFIKFSENPTDQLAATVSGVIVVSEELKRWQINGEARSVKEMAAFLRLKRRFFESAETHTNLLSALQDFKMNVNTDVANKDNRKGETNFSIAKQVKDHGLPESFTVKLPVFVGTEPKSFRIDLEFELRDAGMSIYLLSDELLSLQEKIIEEEFKAVLQGFEGCAVLEVV